MPAILQHERRDGRQKAQLRFRGVMRANVLQSPGNFGLGEKTIPRAGPGEAVVRVLLTTICDTDLDIVRGNFPVRIPASGGLTLGHEAVGVIDTLGGGVTGYEAGQRVLIGAFTPCGHCEACQSGVCGWHLGHTIDGTQAEYVLIPQAQENLAKVPDSVSDEQALVLAHAGSTGFASTELARIQLGDTVAVFTHGAAGLCAALGARLRGASEIIVINSDPAHLALAQWYGATAAVRSGDEAEAVIQAITGGRGVDVACVEMSGTPSLPVHGAPMPSPVEGAKWSIESALRVLRTGGTLQSVGVSCGQLETTQYRQRSACDCGGKSTSIASTLCPGDKSRITRLMRLIGARRVDLSPLMTHQFTLGEIADAYALFASRTRGVLKVGIRVA